VSSVEFEFSETPEIAPVRISAAVIAAIVAFGSLFLPWIHVAKTQGEPMSWAPSKVPGLLILGGFVMLVCVIAAVAESNLQVPRLGTWLLVTVGVLALVANVLVDTIGSALPSVGSLIHIGSTTLVFGSGVGGWLAGGILLIGAGTLRPRQYRQSLAKLLDGRVNQGRALLGLGLLAVWIGRNIPWVRIQWPDGHVSLPSWALPVIGGDCRTLFLIWIICALPVFAWRMRLRLFGLVVSIICSWGICVLACITQFASSGLIGAVANALSLGTTNHGVALATQSGLIVTEVGAAIAGIASFMLMQEIVNEADVVDESDLMTFGDSQDA